MRGLGWAFTSQIGKQGSQFIITVILARLLSPGNFGLLGMATVFTGFASIFNDMGVSGALIQKQDADERHLSSAFWLNIMTGLAIALIFIACSGLIAQFYHMSELKPMLMILSLNYIFAPFTIIQQTILTKDMDFKTLMIRDIVAVIISGAVGIFLAYKGFGVWSLVYQSLTYAATDGILLWTISKWRPSFIFSIAAIKDIFHFSANLTGFNIVNYFARNIDQLLIGKFLGVQALGYYSLAYKIMLYPLQNISWVIGKVMFPAFSKIQGDLQKVRLSYMGLVKITSLITFPLMALLFGIAPELVKVFFGEKWLAIIVLIRILCVCGMIQSIGTTIGNILLSQGRADLQFKMQLIGTCLVLIFVVLGLRYGVSGVAFYYTLQSILWVHITFFITNKLINLGYREFYSKIISSYMISLIMLSIMFLTKYLTIPSLIYKLTIPTLSGIITYFILLIITKEIIIKDRRFIIGALK